MTKTVPLDGKPPRQFWYFAPPQRPIGVTIRRSGGEADVAGAALLDVSCCDPPTTSFGGARLVSPSGLRFDEPIRLDMTNEAIDFTLSASAVVRTLRPAEKKDEWLVGCIFTHEVSLAGLDRCVRAGLLTRRSHVRFPILLSAHAVWEGGAAPADVELTDIGYGGFSLNTSVPATIGTRVQLRIAEPNCKVDLGGHVRWVAPGTDGGYTVGCMFSGNNINECVHQIIDLYRSIVLDPQGLDDVMLARAPGVEKKPSLVSGLLRMSGLWKR